METISLIVMVSIVLEAIIEYFKTVVHMIEEGDRKTAITQIITILTGIAFAFAFHLELFNGAMAKIYEDLSVNSYFDMVLTGILFSRGSNCFSDLVSKLKSKNTSIGELMAIAQDGMDDIFFEDADEDYVDGEDGDVDGLTDDSEA